MSFTHFHIFSTIIKETNSFQTVMQLIKPNYSCKNGVKQIQINQDKLSQSCIFSPNAQNPDPSNRVKMQQKIPFLVFNNICHITEWIWFFWHVLFFLRLLDGQFGLFELRTSSKELYKVVYLCYETYSYFQGIRLVKCCCWSCPPKLSKIIVVTKHYRKMLVIKQFLRKALSLYFYFLLNHLKVQNANTQVVIDFLLLFFESFCSAFCHQMHPLYFDDN